MKKLKVSSIFHTLYACLLLAPVFAVGTACVQTAFHGSEISVVEPKFGTLNDGSQDFKDDVWYTIGKSSLVSNDFIGFTTGASETDLFIAYTDGDNTYSWNFSCNDSNLTLSCSNVGILNITLEDENFPVLVNEFSLNFGTDVKEVLFSFKFKGLNYKSFPQGNIVWYWSDFPQEYLPYLQKDYTEGVGDVFYSSVDKVSTSPFFNWAEKSFLGEGFRYAGNIFGMPSDSPFYTFACYWLAISILWLIFDVLIYVPMLAHRWLDRGAIE